MNIPLKDWSGASATEDLHKTIVEFNVETSRQNRRLLFLTWVIVVLTAVMAVEVAVQICLVIRR